MFDIKRAIFFPFLINRQKRERRKKNKNNFPTQLFGFFFVVFLQSKNVQFQIMYSC